MAIEPFITDKLRDSSGSPVTGLTGANAVKLSLLRKADALWFDFSDLTFKATPTTLTTDMAEIHATRLPGQYAVDVTLTTWDDGVYIAQYETASTSVAVAQRKHSGGFRTKGGKVVEQFLADEVQSKLASAPTIISPVDNQGNITLYRLSDYASDAFQEIKLTLNVDLTGNQEIWWTMKEKKGDADPGILQKKRTLGGIEVVTAATGTIRIVVANADISTISPKRYYYDIKARKNLKATAIYSGSCSVKEEITDATS